jgi:hypothetical protein
MVGKWTDLGRFFGISATKHKSVDIEGSWIHPNRNRLMFCSPIKAIESLSLSILESKRFRHAEHVSNVSITRKLLKQLVCSGPPTRDGNIKYPFRNFHHFRNVNVFIRWTCRRVRFPPVSADKSWLSISSPRRRERDNNKGSTDMRACRGFHVRSGKGRAEN